jgi:hypothetical protein
MAWVELLVLNNSFTSTASFRPYLPKTCQLQKEWLWTLQRRLSYSNVTRLDQCASDVAGSLELAVGFDLGWRCREVQRGAERCR